jgi:hypothetical protein
MIILLQYFYVYIYLPILSRESRVWLLANHVCAFSVFSVVISICTIEIDVGFMVPIGFHMRASRVIAKQLGVQHGDHIDICGYKPDVMGPVEMLH